MLCRSAPEAKSTVAPRRSASGWQAGSDATTRSAGRRRRDTRGKYRTGVPDGEAGNSPDASPVAPAGAQRRGGGLRRADAHVLPAASRPGRSCATARRPRGHRGAGRRPAARARPRPAAPRAIRLVARPLRARRLGHQHRDGPSRRAHARGGVAGDGATGGDLAAAELSARHRGGRAPGGARRTAGHDALRGDGDTVRPARLLARR